MKKILSRVSAVILLVLLCLTLLPDSAFAAGTIDVSVPVSVKATGEAPSPAETYTFRLTPVTQGAPMPAGSADYADLAITGTDTESFPDIPFVGVGEYVYKVSQIAGTHERGHYDGAVYYVRITIVNAENGGFASYVSAHKDALMQDDKQSIEFVNDYDIPVCELTVRKVWSDNGKNRPDSVTVELLDGGAVVDTITLGAWNDWSYTWSELDAREGHSWKVREANVPQGYKASYSSDGSTVTIRNTLSLIQTGQLNWPVPVMAGAGGLLVLSGIAVLLKKRKSDNA